MITSSPFNIILLLIILLPLLSVAKPDQVIELFRHGARSPIFPYDESWSSSEYGQLTTVGMLQHYNLGKKLADKYSHLVESGYNPDDVYILSNFVSRCVESAMAQVASLFRGKTSTIITEHPQKDLQDRVIERITPFLSDYEADRGEFVPVNIDIVKDLEEKVIFNGRNRNWCSKIGSYMNENLLSAEMAQGWNIFQDSIQEVNALLPPHQQIRDMMALNIAYDAFISDIYENRTLPGGIDDPRLLESLNYAQAYYQEILEHRTPIQRGLASFPTLKAIVDQLKNFRKGNNPKKLALFSGHDMNLYAVLSAFEIISPECLLANYQDFTQEKPRSYPNCRFPEFAASLIFEFYNDTTDPYVKFYYDDVLIPLCNGQESCTYDEFLSFVQKAGGDNTIGIWNEKCENQKSHQHPRDKNATNSNQDNTNKTETRHKKDKHHKDPLPPASLNQTQTNNNTSNTNSTSQNPPTYNANKTNVTQDKPHQETKVAESVSKIESKTANKWLFIGPAIVVVLGLIFFLRRMWHSIKIAQKGYTIGEDQEQEEDEEESISA